MDEIHTPGWAGQRELDERFFADWVAYGLVELDRYMQNVVRLDAWIAAKEAK